MNLKKSIFNLLVILLIFATGCSENVHLDTNNNKSLKDTSNIEDFKNIDKELSNQRYSYPTDNKYVSVITYKSKKLIMKEYMVNEDGTIELTLPKGSLFIISLYANHAIAYTWEIKNSIDNGVIKLENRSWIDLPMPKSDKEKEGVSYSRQNFYLKSLKSGVEKIVMRYEHKTEQRDEIFEITLNAKIEE